MNTVDKITREIEDKVCATEAMKEMILKYEAEIEAIHKETHHDDADFHAVSVKVNKSIRRPKDIPAEDALDTKLRLEGTLNILKKRNHILNKEFIASEKKVKDSTRLLMRKKKEHDRVHDVTGYSKDVHFVICDEEEAFKDKIQKMIAVENEMRKEQVGVDLIIRKKQQLVASLVAELDILKEKENHLCQIYNDIRVADRDCNAIKAKIQEIKQDDQKTDGIMTTINDNRQDLVAIQSLESDKEFIKAQVDAQKAIKKNQDEISKAQMFRARVLQSRLDIVMDALRDMKMDRDLERCIGNNTLIPASDGNIADLDRILPPNETIPVEMYELLHRDNEAMGSCADRKYIIVTEKEGCIIAQENKVEALTAQLQHTIKQQEQSKVIKGVQEREARDELCRQHEELRNELGKLVIENTKLKSILNASKRAQNGTSILSEVQAR